MDESNYENILLLSRSEEDSQKVSMILKETHPTKNLSVPDPYYGGVQDFENVYKMLDEACKLITKKL